jgi:hypothetical protein
MINSELKEEILAYLQMFKSLKNILNRQINEHLIYLKTGAKASLHIIMISFNEDL